MDSKQVEELLQRYWRCETTVEEEVRLRYFFCREDVPMHLRRYRSLFTYQQQQREENLGADFDTRLLAAIASEAPMVEARKDSLLLRLMPLFKAVAVVAVLLLLGGVMRHSFSSEGREMAVADTIGNRITTPSVAFTKKEAVEVKDTLVTVPPSPRKGSR